MPLRLLLLLLLLLTMTGGQMTAVVGCWVARALAAAGRGRCLVSTTTAFEGQQMQGAVAIVMLMLMLMLMLDVPMWGEKQPRKAVLMGKRRRRLPREGGTPLYPEEIYKSPN
jgi:hypothetical protein